MSPIRSDREKDCGQAGGEPDRLPAALRATPVAGPAQVEALLELHLAHCRRRRLGLALVCISVVSAERPGGEIDPSLEARVREEVSNRIGNAVRGVDAILRESDRDLCVVLFGVDAEVARRVVARLERLVNGDYSVDGARVQVAVRIGSAVHPNHGGRAQDLLRRAADRD